MKKVVSLKVQAYIMTYKDTPYFSCRNQYKYSKSIIVLYVLLLSL